MPGPSTANLVLSGLGNLLGGIGQGTIAADTLGQHQRMIDLMQRGQELQNEARTTDVGPLFQAMGLPAPGGMGRVATPIAGEIAKIAEGRRVLGEQLASGRQAGGIIGAAAGGDPRLQALSSALGLNLSASDRGLIQDYLAPKPPVVVPPGASAISQQGAPVFTPPPPARPGPTPFGYVQEPSINPAGQTAYGAPRAMNAMEHFVASQDPSIDAATRARHLEASNYGKLVPVTEGGFAVGGGNVARGLPAGASPTGQSTPTVSPGLVMGPQKPPVPEQQDKLANYDTAMTNIRKLEVMAQDPEVKQMLGSLGTNPGGALARRAEEGVNIPLVGQFNLSTLTPKQREFMGLMAATRTAALRSQEGLRPNVQFQQLLAPALSSLADPGISDKLRTLGDFMATNRASLQYELGQANRLAPPPPATAERPAATPPTPQAGRIRVRSRSDPGRMGWLNAGEPVPPDVEVVR